MSDGQSFRWLSIAFVVVYVSNNYVGTTILRPYGVYTNQPFQQHVAQRILAETFDSSVKDLEVAAGKEGSGLGDLPWKFRGLLGTWLGISDFHVIFDVQSVSPSEVLEIALQGDPVAQFWASLLAKW